MIRTIFVTFPNNGKYTKNAKQYAFLCSYDNVNIGDIIIDNRYNSPMLVVNISHNINRHLNGFVLKDIIISSIKQKSINSKQEKMDTTRTLSITLAQAREWYQGNDATLKKLALSIFKEEELIDFDVIRTTINASYITIPYILGKEGKEIALGKLRVIAEYFNKGWKKTKDNTGYFLGQLAKGFTYDINIKWPGLPDNIEIIKHNTVYYPGIVYFRNPDDILKAMRILDSDIEALF